MGPLPALVPVFLLYLLRVVPEDAAWGGFALPRLQARRDALISGLIVGMLWALWHLPLLLTEDNVMSAYPLIPYLLYVIGLSPLYTWLFNSTGGSVLVVTVFHAASNTFGSFDVAEAAVVLLLAAAVVFGPAHLSRRGGRVVENVGS